jgi:hypothetical protein
VLKQRGATPGRLADWEFFTAGCPRLRVLVAVFVRLRQEFPGTLLWSLGAGSLTESTVDVWVQRVVALGDATVQADLYSSHSMRVGAASGMNAVGVPRDTIRVWIRWKTPGMLDVYIRPVPADEVLRNWFGWLLHRPPALRA